jgi:hypothetical protein
MVLLDLQAMDIIRVARWNPFSAVSVLLCQSAMSVEVCWRSDLSLTLCS